MENWAVLISIGHTIQLNSEEGRSFLEIIILGCKK